MDSSAAVERIFSQINLVKTKTKNKLNTATLNGLVPAKATFDSATCYNFKILPSHLSRMTEEIYKTEDSQACWDDGNVLQYMHLRRK